MDKLWGQAREELQRIVGADSFATWIEPLRLTGVSEGTATIACPTRFLSDWVSRHYSGDILKVLDRIEGPFRGQYVQTRNASRWQSARASSTAGLKAVRSPR